MVHCLSFFRELHKPPGTSGLAVLRPRSPVLVKKMANVESCDDNSYAVCLLAYAFCTFVCFSLCPRMYDNAKAYSSPYGLGDITVFVSASATTHLAQAWTGDLSYQLARLFACLFSSLAELPFKSEIMFYTRKGNLSAAATTNRSAQKS